jgi:hypothetical protein
VFGVFSGTKFFREKGLLKKKVKKLHKTATNQVRALKSHRYSKFSQKTTTHYFKKPPL